MTSNDDPNQQSWQLRLAVRIGDLLAERGAPAHVAQELTPGARFRIQTSVPVMPPVRFTVKRHPKSEPALESIAREIAEEFVRIRRAAIGLRAG
jgi:hypothetical protein